MRKRCFISALPRACTTLRGVEYRPHFFPSTDRRFALLLSRLSTVDGSRPSKGRTSGVHTRRLCLRKLATYLVLFRGQRKTPAHENRTVPSSEAHHDLSYL